MVKTCVAVNFELKSLLCSTNGHRAAIFGTCVFSQTPGLPNPLYLCTLGLNKAIIILHWTLQLQWL